MHVILPYLIVFAIGWGCGRDSMRRSIQRQIGDTAQFIRGFLPKDRQ